MPSKLKSDPHLEIAHVLFIDVVGYSKLLVNEQREVVEQLNQIVRKTSQFRKSEAAGKLIRIPVGDGMALVFFQTPEEPVQCAMEIARTLKNHPNVRLRMGVHSGPVDQVKDVNNRTNVAGAGINIAQRVMDCADAGHILVSKRVAEDLAQSAEWESHLQHLGECEVKHGAKVDIFNFYDGEVGNAQTPQKIRERPTSKPCRRNSWIGAGIVAVGLVGLLMYQHHLRRSSVAANSSAKSIAVIPFEN